MSCFSILALSNDDVFAFRWPNSVCVCLFVCIDAHVPLLTSGKKKSF
jgi:hypothetical protein